MARQKGDGWTDGEHRFLRDNFFTMTNKQLAYHINQMRTSNGKMTISGVRHECANLGLTRSYQIRWSDSDIMKLKAWYPLLGDTEIASYLNEVGETFRIINGDKTYRSFTKKHVCKKRALLGLRRTREQLDRVNADNLLVNTPETIRKLWETRGVMEDGSIRIWAGRRYIKIDGSFTPYARWYYDNHVRKLDPNEIVYHADGDTLNDDPSNLAIIDRAGLAKMNRQYYTPELREAIKALKLLIKTIEKDEKQDQ